MPRCGQRAAGSMGKPLNERDRIQRHAPVAGLNELSAAQKNKVDLRTDSLEPANIKWFGGFQRSLEKTSKENADLNGSGSPRPVVQQITEKKTIIHEAEGEQSDLVKRARSLRGVVERASWEGEDAR